MTKIDIDGVTDILKGSLQKVIDFYDKVLDLTIYKINYDYPKSNSLHSIYKPCSPVIE